MSVHACSQKYAPPAPRDKRIYPRNLVRKFLRARLAWTRRRSEDPGELPGRHQPVLEHDVADRDAPRLCLLDDLRGDVVAEIGRERRGLDTAPREELAHPGAVHPEPGDAPRPQ